MTDISWTDVADFVSKSGNRKFSKVKEINPREEYHPAFDFWKSFQVSSISLRKTIVDDGKLLQVNMDVDDN